MIKHTFFSLIICTLALTACQPQNEAPTPSSPAIIVAKKSSANSKQQSALQNLAVGKTTIQEMQAIYPDAIKAEQAFMSFGDRIVTEKSNSIDGYMRDIKGNLAQNVMIFDRQSQVLQTMTLLRADNNTKILLKELEAAGFTPYTTMTAAEFEILKTRSSPTLEQRKADIKRLGIKEFKKGDNIYAILIPHTANQMSQNAGIIVMNLAYAPTHRAHWEKEQAQK